MQALICEAYTIELFTAEEGTGIIYAIMDREDAWRLLKNHKLALAAISGMDWNRKLSP